MNDIWLWLTRRYSIEIRDAETDKVVIFTAADWTEEELAAVAQITRLAGLPDDNCLATVTDAERR